MCEQLLANPLIETFEIEIAPVTARRAPPAIAVVTFPGSNDDRDAAHALDLLGADAALVWHAEGSCRPSTRRAPGRLLVRRLPALRRDRAFRAGDGRRARASPRTAGRYSGSATASRCCARPGCCRACSGQRVARVRLPRRAVRVENADTPFTSRASRPAARDPRQARRGLLVPDGEPRRAGGEPARSCSATRRHEPERLARRRRRRRNAAATCMGLMPHPEHAVDPLLGSPDGASSWARSSTQPAPGWPSRPSPSRSVRNAAASSGWPRAPRAAVSRSSDRASSRPAPHRACAPVEYASRTSRSPASVSSSCTCVENSRPGACCATTTSSTSAALPHGVAFFVAMRDRSRETRDVSVPDL